MDTLTVGSLFSGVGGLDLGLERAGMTVAWHSEIDPYASRVLAHHWPDVPNLGDVTAIDWETVPNVDLICGGYPCQPFSSSGNRNGHDDPRHLWPHMRDAISVLRPRYALLENVAGHLSLGFDSVLSDLAALGFDAEWSVVSACSVGAPHARRRLFCLAYPNGMRELQQGRGISDLGERTGDGSWWSIEPDVGRVAYGVPRAVDRLRTLGNSVVPQVAELIGRRILASV